MAGARVSAAEVEAAMATERATFEVRLARVAERAVTHVHELGKIADLAHGGAVQEVASSTPEPDSFL